MSKKDSIIKQIRDLLDELEQQPEGAFIKGAKLENKKGSSATHASADKYKGCMGGIMYLVDRSFFTQPKSGKEVADELKKEGWHYSSSLISMNLLGLTRQRKLTRLEGGAKKEWLYVIRK